MHIRIALSATSTWSSSGSRRARTKERRTCARFVASSLPKALTLFQLEKVNCARRFKGSLISRGFVLRPDDQRSSCARFPCLFPRCLNFILLETFSEAPLKLNARRSRCAARLHIRINCRPCGDRSMRLERWALPQKRFQTAESEAHVDSMHIGPSNGSNPRKWRS